MKIDLSFELVLDKEHIYDLYKLTKKDYMKKFLDIAETTMKVSYY